MPVISDGDCLGEVYNNSGAIIVKSPIREHLKEYTQEVIKALKDKNHADKVIEKCMEFAKKHTWKHTSDKITTLIMSHAKFKS